MLTRKSSWAMQCVCTCWNAWTISRLRCVLSTSCRGHDGQGHPPNIWLCFRMSLAVVGEMMVTAGVSRMAVHSATVAWRERGHSESGIRCPGSSSFRIILVAVKPVNSNRIETHVPWCCRKCCRRAHSTLPETGRLAARSSPKSDRQPAVATTPLGPSQSTCPPHPAELCQEHNFQVHQISPTEWHRILQPRTLCWRLVRAFKKTFPCLVAQLSFFGGPSGNGDCTLRSSWFAGWTGASACALRACSSVSRVSVSCGVDQLWSRNPCEVSRWLRSLSRWLELSEGTGTVALSIWSAYRKLRWSQAQGETEEAMSKAALWVSRPTPCPSSSSAARGAAGRRSASSGGTPSRSTSV